MPLGASAVPPKVEYALTVEERTIGLVLVQLNDWGTGWPFRLSQPSPVFGYSCQIDVVALRSQGLEDKVLYCDPAVQRLLPQCCPHCIWHLEFESGPFQRGKEGFGVLGGRGRRSHRLG